MGFERTPRPPVPTGLLLIPFRETWLGVGVCCSSVEDWPDVLVFSGSTLRLCEEYSRDNP